MLLEKLAEIPGVQCNTPQGAFYIFPDISYYFGKSDGKDTINNANDFCMYLLNKCRHLIKFDFIKEINSNK